MPFPSKPHVNWDLIRQLAMDGVPTTELAIRFNVSRGTIWFHSRKEAWKLPSTAKRNAALALRNPAVKKLFLRRSDASLLETFANASKMTRADLADAVKRVAKRLKRMDDEQLLANLSKLRSTAEVANILFAWNGAKRLQNDGLRPDLFALTPDQLAKLAAMEMDAKATPIDQNAG